MDYSQLAQQLAQAYSMNDQAQIALGPLQEARVKANTFSRPSGHAGNILEGFMEALQRPGVEDRYQSGLKEALASQRGVDQLIGQIQAMQAAMELEDERNWKLYEGDYTHNRETQTKREDAETLHKRQGELQKQKDAASMERVKARGNPANVTYNIPSGYMPVDLNNPMAGVKPIPGSKEAMEMEQAEKAQERSRTAAAQTHGHILDVVSRAKAKVSPMTTGVPGSMASHVAGSDRKDLEGYLKTLQSNQMLETLKELKEQSSTGASGLGQLSNREGEMLVSRIAALDPNQSDEKIMEDLTFIERHYSNMLKLADGQLPDDYNPDALRQQAQEAIKAGADPQAVQAELEKMLSEITGG